MYQVHVSRRPTRPSLPFDNDAFYQYRDEPSYALENDQNNNPIYDNLPPPSDPMADALGVSSADGGKYPKEDSFLSKVDEKLSREISQANTERTERPGSGADSPRRANLVYRLRRQIDALSEEIEELDLSIARAQRLANRNSFISDGTLFLSIILPLIVVALSSFSDFEYKAMLITALSIWNVGASALTYAFNLYPDGWLTAVVRDGRYRKYYVNLRMDLEEAVGRDPIPLHPELSNPFNYPLGDSDSLCTRARKIYRAIEEDKLQADIAERNRRNEERKQRFAASQVVQFASSPQSIPMSRERRDSSISDFPRNSFETCAGETHSTDGGGGPSLPNSFGAAGREIIFNPARPASSSHSRSPISRSHFPPPPPTMNYNTFSTPPVLHPFSTPPRRARSRESSHQSSYITSSRSMMRGASEGSVMEHSPQRDEVFQVGRRRYAVHVNQREHRWEMDTPFGNFAGSDIETIIGILAEASAWPPHYPRDFDSPGDLPTLEIEFDTLDDETVRRLYEYARVAKADKKRKGKSRLQGFPTERRKLSDLGRDSSNG